MTDPRNPSDPDDHDDDAIGFATPRSLHAAPPPPLPGAPADEPAVFPAPFPAMTEAPPAPPPPGEAETFPARDRFEPQSLSAVTAQDPAPAGVTTAAPAQDPVGVPGATRPFERVLGSADGQLQQFGGERVALAAYACLVGAILTGGALIAIALFLAHRTRRTGEGWVRSHAEYQFKTSVVGVIGVIIGLVTLPLGFGVFILTVAIVWAMVRGVSGLMKFLKRQPLGAVPLWSLP